MAVDPVDPKRAPVPVTAPSPPVPIRARDEREQRMPGVGLPSPFPDGLRVTFAEIETEFTLTLFKRGRDDDPSAMVTVSRLVDGGGRTRVHQGRLLLHGPQARMTFSTMLSKRTGRWSYTVDWLFVLEQVVAYASDYLEVGEPFIDLWEVEPPAATPYLFEPLLLDNELTLIYGDGGTLKSYLAMLLCLGVASGVFIPALGRPGRGGGCLYLDYETNPGTHARRLRALAAGLSVGPQPGKIHYRQMVRPLHEDAAQIRRFIAERDIALVVIDSVGMACGGSITKPDDVLRSITAMTTLGNCAKLGIGHKNKGDDYLGSVYWRNGPRALWEVNAEQDQEGRKRIGYLHRKANDDRIRDPFALAVEFEPGGRILWEEIDPSTVQSVQERAAAGRPEAQVSDRQRVRLAVIRLAQASAEDIAREAELDIVTTRRVIGRLVQLGEIQRLGDRPTGGRPQLYGPTLSGARVIEALPSPQPQEQPSESAADDNDDGPDELPF